MILAIDPGLSKCGLAVLDSDKVYLREIVEIKNIAERVSSILASFKISEVVVGDSTGSDAVIKALKVSVPIKKVPEKFTTLEARKLYWKENPPQGLFRFIPTSFLFPPRPVDDYAAVVVGKRYLANISA
ncbi:hypothetical protein A2276_06575 [candidate division WOR-1 bacterium RIFOXYA12_FULL_43_27]|uniref:YqgF/RNase H-like domain-containing protein n=1 Tax=candidate division WOR-1 bacterium RIFOXYC2_FULL_46_14 TaxID=1802587 RepID=A0A1F4U5K6_UNCSA|nr:MAG: hypothetical protein A2276_06575 [candidate division WOR-1 bacterium RIFOXYA12_FULL_43_27]OGC20311.1 MAG: hypothetical protein A2292_04575 [candidate division WOR-1 bacterium RIFOXYB2_FULL_46_45]OGC31952.1 MAG: hypothetical protein A2232_06875 [candidate division WOR-1 bacterium RIFOXYA2_FULL_46_56]OGC40157.1 MAG: hypothetical protein A2438_02595 [candidate division WOR-1 bacterium RIFOXYC2_FULL_46_14]